MNIKFRPFFLFFFPQALIIFFKLSYKNKINAVITYSILEGILGVIIKFFYKDIKLIISIHGDELLSIELIKGNKIIKRIYMEIFTIIEKIVIKRSNFLIFISKYHKDIILRRTGNENNKNVAIILNDISERIINLSKYPAIRFDKNKKTIGYVGALQWEAKGLKYLINAFIRINKEIPNSQLIIIGNGPDTEKINAFINLNNLSGNVILVGFLSNPIPYIKGFDLVVLPSLSEGISTVLLESLYVGTPVIGSKVGGTPEVLLYNELLFKPKETEELAKKIISILLNNGHYNLIRELCLERKEFFQFNNTVEIINKIQKIIDCNYPIRGNAPPIYEERAKF
nr:glycosyltransferase [uncultured Methanospirillum sp.]